MEKGPKLAKVGQRPKTESKDNLQNSNSSWESDTSQRPLKQSKYEYRAAACASAVHLTEILVVFAALSVQPQDSRKAAMSKVIQ